MANVKTQIVGQEIDVKNRSEERIKHEKRIFRGSRS
nr:MAG TPA: hypothetical protein [Caudoviricetes sp.]